MTLLSLVKTLVLNLVKPEKTLKQPEGIQSVVFEPSVCAYVEREINKVPSV